MTFRIGQKVVRVGSQSPTYEHAWLKEFNFTFPKIGDVVTIKTINDWAAKTLLTFYEHDNSHLVGIVSKIEPGFPARCFRPLVERKTDIRFAHEILRKASRPAKIPARANQLVPSAHHRQQGE